MANFTPVGVEAQVRGLNKFLGGIGKMNAAITGFATAVSTFVINSVAELAGEVVNLGKQSVEAAISYESAFAGVIKTTDGLVDETGKLTDIGEELRQGFRDLSKEIPIAVEELAGIGELGGQLGVSRDSLIEFTETIAAMGVSTNLTTEDAATEMARMANVMGSTGRLGDRAFSMIGSAIVELGNNFATTERDIMNFASRISGAGAIAGLTESDVLAIGAAMSSVGVQAEAGGTAVQKVLLSMNEAVVNGGDMLEIFAATSGRTVEDFSDMWEEDAAGVFQDFVTGLGMAGDDAISILDALELKDQRLTRAFLSLAGSGDLLRNALDSAGFAFQKNIALTEEAEKRYATTESQIQIFKNTLRDIGITIGESVLPFLNKALEFAKPFIEEFGQRLPGLIEEGIERIRPVFKFLVNFFSREGPGALDTLRGKWTGVWTFIKSRTDFIVKRITEDILPQLVEIGEFIVESWEKFQPALDNILQIIMAAFDFAMKTILNVVEIALQILRGDWEGAFETLKQIMIDSWEFIQIFFTQALEGILNTLGLTLTEAVTAWRNTWENFKTIAEEIWDSIKDSVRTKVQDFIKSITGGIKDAIDAAKKLLGIGSPSKVFVGIGQDITRGLIQGISSMTPALQTSLGSQLAMAATPMAAPSIVRNNSVQIGPNNISNGMDMAMFNQRVQQTVVNLL